MISYYHIIIDTYSHAVSSYTEPRVLDIFFRDLDTPPRRSGDRLLDYLVSDILRIA